MATVLFMQLASTAIHLATASVVNVAQGKPAFMSSSKPGYSAGSAVDGNTDAGGITPQYIIDTGTGYDLAWWKVDLQREVKDATVRIYFRTDYTRARNGVELYTSTSSFPDSNPTSQGQLCHTVTGDRSGSDIPDVYNVTCPGRWSYLLLYTDTDNDGRGPVLDFGEVQVLACNQGINYGVNCSKSCSDRHCTQSSSLCDTKTGQCSGGCQEGWRGADCTSLCGDGTYGPDCTENCGQCAGVCDGVDGRCPAGCLEGYYGPYCREKCSYCDGVCDRVNGLCYVGCLDGYSGAWCNVTRLQWVNNPGDNKQVQVSRDVTQMSNKASQPSDVSEHAPSSSHMYNNDYDVLDSGRKAADKDYDVIEQKHYTNV